MLATGIPLVNDSQLDGAGRALSALQTGVWLDAPQLQIPAHQQLSSLVDSTDGSWWSDAGPGPHAERRLKNYPRATPADDQDGGSPAAAARTEPRKEQQPWHDEQTIHNIVFGLFSIAIFAQLSVLMNLAIMPFHSLNILMLSVVRMLTEDLRIFMVLFTMFLLQYFLAMYVVYPYPSEPGAFNDVAGAFNGMRTAINALVDLAFIGEPIDMDLEKIGSMYSSNGDLLRTMTMSEQINMWMFVVFYYWYVLVAMVLLLNLLIAVFGNTYSTVQKDSTLQYRKTFARRILRLELIAEPPLIQEGAIRAGVLDPDTNKCAGPSTPLASAPRLPPAGVSFACRVLSTVAPRPPPPILHPPTARRWLRHVLRCYYPFRAVQVNVEGRRQVMDTASGNIFGEGDDADGDFIPDHEDFDVDPAFLVPPRLSRAGSYTDELSMDAVGGAAAPLRRSSTAKPMERFTSRETPYAEDTPKGPLRVPSLARPLP